MHYKITHTTTYTYTQAVPICHNLVHLAPRELPGQNCKQFRLLTQPAAAEQLRWADYFGNQVDFFTIQEAHAGLEVTAVSRMQRSSQASPEPNDSPTWEDVVAQVRRDRSAAGLGRYLFTLPSAATGGGQDVSAFAELSFPPGRPLLEAGLDLTRRIYEEFSYDTEATHVHSTLSEVLERRAGVCQDFAHLQIACLRAMGLPTRYVSGYLRTLPPPGKPRLVGADASHAWLALWCGDALGWLDLDPTNNVIPATDHITVAWGRDYADVCPIQGVFVGGGQHQMAVSVDVAQVDS